MKLKLFGSYNQKGKLKNYNIENTNFLRKNYKINNINIIFFDKKKKILYITHDFSHIYYNNKRYYDTLIPIDEIKLNKNKKQMIYTIYNFYDNDNKKIVKKVKITITFNENGWNKITKFLNV